MRTPLIALSLLLTSWAAQAADHSYLYGTDNPNKVQWVNRRFTLIEHAMMDTLTSRYENDVNQKAPPKTGYRFDRKAKYELAWGQYKDVLKAVNDASKSIEAAQKFAAEVRPTYSWLATDYLIATAKGLGDPEKLTDFESDMLVSYLKWAPEDVFAKFQRDWIAVTVPRSPEEHTKLAERVSHMRAFLRAEMHDYVDHTPTGTVEPADQFSAIERKSRALISMEKEQLLPFYRAARMTYPEAPKEPADVKLDVSSAPLKSGPFLAHFTAQEHAILTYTLSSEKDRKNFAADQKAFDADRAKGAPLVKRWKANAWMEAQTYLKTPITESAEARTLDRLTPFENTYLQFRLEKISADAWKHLERIAEGSEEAAKNGDTGAPKRLIDHLRGLVKADMQSYVAGKEDMAVKAWAAKALKPSRTFGDLFPDRDKLPIKTPADAVRKLFADPVERAFVEHLLSAAPDRAAKEAELMAAAAAGKDEALTGRWRKEVRAAVVSQLDAPNDDVSAMLKKSNVSEKDLLGYYCPTAPGPTTATSGATAMNQLKETSHTSEHAANSSSDEGAKSQAQLGGASRSSALCQDWTNAKKKHDAGTGTYKPTSPTSKITPVPEPTASADSKLGKDKPNIKGPETSKPKEPMSLSDRMDRVAGASLGGGLLGLLGLAAGFGPVGLIVMFCVGAAAGAAAVHFL